MCSRTPSRRHEARVSPSSRSSGSRPEKYEVSATRSYGGRDSSANTCDGPLAGGVAVGQRLDEAVGDHAAADHDAVASAGVQSDGCAQLVHVPEPRSDSISPDGSGVSVRQRACRLVLRTGCGVLSAAPSLRREPVDQAADDLGAATAPGGGPGRGGDARRPCWQPSSQALTMSPLVTPLQRQIVASAGIRVGEASIGPCRRLRAVRSAGTSRAAGSGGSGVRRSKATVSDAETCGAPRQLTPTSRSPRTTTSTWRRALRVGEGQHPVVGAGVCRRARPLRDQVDADGLEPDAFGQRARSSSSERTEPRRRAATPRPERASERASRSAWCPAGGDQPGDTVRAARRSRRWRAPSGRPGDARSSPDHDAARRSGGRRPGEPGRSRAGPRRRPAAGRRRRTESSVSRTATSSP